MSATIRTPTGGGLIPKIEVTGIENAGELNIPGWHATAKNVYGEGGVSPTVCATHNNKKTKVLIENAGELDIPGWHRHAKEVTGTGGVAPCISTQSNNLKTKVLIEKKEEEGENRVIYAGELDISPFMEARRVMSKDGISVTITAEHFGINFPKVML